MRSTEEGVADALGRRPGARGPELEVGGARTPRGPRNAASHIGKAAARGESRIPTPKESFPQGTRSRPPETAKHSPMSRKGPKPLERKARPAAPAALDRREGEAEDRAEGPRAPAHNEAYQVAQLSKLSPDGPLVSVSKEIRHLFDRAMASTEQAQQADDDGHGDVLAEGSGKAPSDHRRGQDSRGSPQGGGEDVAAADDSTLERELAATEAHAFKLAMEREGRRLQADAQRKISEYDRSLQEELEQKVAGLLDEKEERTKEAEALKEVLQRRMHSLQLMVVELDEKVESYSASYDTVLLELRKEYQELMSSFKAEVEQENRAKLLECMKSIRSQRQLLPPS